MSTSLSPQQTRVGGARRVQRAATTMKPVDLWRSEEMQLVQVLSFASHALTLHPSRPCIGSAVLQRKLRVVTIPN